jgi:hypothetical protein
MIQIVEIIRRSTQGITRPFVCRGDDDEIYFVKGVGAGRRSQICEWIAGRLGCELGLPIPPFEIVDIPEELVRSGGMEGLSELGAGPAFGSQRHTLMELPYSAVAEIPPETQWDVLAFDWWVRNGDRTLSAQGGNPNLFWDPETRELLVLDHNQAFDPDFSAADFRDHHAFAAQIPALFGDLVRRQEYAERLEATLKRWEEICDEMPAAWRFADAEETIPADFDSAAAWSQLTLCSKDEFWKLP